MVKCTKKAHFNKIYYILLNFRFDQCSKSAKIRDYKLIIHLQLHTVSTCKIRSDDYKYKWSNQNYREMRVRFNCELYRQEEY